MARGQSPRITADVAERAADLSDAFDAYVRQAGIVEIEALRIRKRAVQPDAGSVAAVPHGAGGAHTRTERAGGSTTRSGLIGRSRLAAK